MKFKILGRTTLSVVLYPAIDGEIGMVSKVTFKDQCILEIDKIT